MSVQRQVETEEVAERERNEDQHDADLDVALPGIAARGNARKEHQEDDAGDHVHDLRNEREAAKAAQDDGDIREPEIDWLLFDKQAARRQDHSDEQQQSADHEWE